MKIILIDGFSIMFRAYYATAYTPYGMLQTSSGVYTNAIVGFANLLEKIHDNANGYMMIAFDTKAKTIRHEAYEDYKAHRKPMPEELAMQVPIIKELVNLWGITQIGIDGYEADDVIGTIAKWASKKNIGVEIYSSDRDLLQLVDENISVHLLKKGMKEVHAYTPEVLYEEMGISPKQIIDLKALMGDASDNIIGIPGVGEKTALKLLYEYGDVSNIYANSDKLKGKVGESIRQSKEIVDLNLDLVTIDTNVPLEINLDNLVIEEIKEEELIAFYEKYELRRLKKRYLDLNGDDNKEKEIAKRNLKEEEVVNKPIETIEKKEELKTNDNVIVLSNEEEIKKVLNKTLSIYFEYEDINYHTTDLWGIGLSDGENNYFLDPEVALYSETFKTYLENPNIEKWVYDVKSAIVFLNRFDIKLVNVSFDLMLASYIALPNFSNESITDVVNQYDELIDLPLDEDIYGKGVKKSLPDDENIYQVFIGRKAQAASLLRPICEKQLIEQKQVELFYDVELPLAFILAKMEIAGILIDRAELLKQKEILGKQINNLEHLIFNLAGKEFNIKSVKQLGEVLFEELKLPVIKKTKTGYSTDAETLNKLIDEHPIISNIIEYRQLVKLYDTYIIGLEKIIFPNNRIHTIYKQALTQTGRLSSIEPNLQNIPIRTEQGRLIRKIFISEENKYLVSVDYSQIELRVLAHIGKVENLLKAFKNNEDIHTSTAKAVFKLDEINESHRRSAKAVNFGIIYGMGAWSLSQDLGVAVEEAAGFINKYFEVYPEIKDYMENIEESAKKDGYVKTLLNRRRYTPGINFKNKNQQQFAKRTALNSPIQGTAADILKVAMIEVDKYLTTNDLKTEMLLQVHDELVFSVPKEELEKVLKDLPTIMASVFNLSVPLIANISHGKTWYDL